jgi:hypothetical protein
MSFQDAESPAMYLVTARHVAEVPYDLIGFVTVVSQIGESETYNTLSVSLELRRADWVFHPRGATATSHAVDVAVIPVPLLNIEGLPRFKPVSLRYCTTKCIGGPTQLGDDPDGLENVIVFGFPEDFGIELSMQRPIVRQGLVSLTSVEPMSVDGKAYDPYAFLVDARVFSGDSGSPIIRPGPTGFVVLGIVTRARTLYQYTFAEPASRIKQTILHARGNKLNYYPWRVWPKLNTARWEE